MSCPNCARLKAEAQENKEAFKIAHNQAEENGDDFHALLAQLNDFHAMIKHALRLGHLGEGSTNKWATQLVAKFEQWKAENGNL